MTPEVSAAAGRVVAGEPLAISQDAQARSIPDLVRRTVARSPERVALRWKSGDGWAAWTYGELWDRVAAAATGLRRLGVQAGDRVVILSRSRPEWVVFDLASLGLGAVVCPLYPGDPPARMADIIRRVHARLVVVEDAKLLIRLRAAGSAGGGVPVIGMDDDAVALPGVTAAADLLAAALTSEDNAWWDAAWAGVTRDQVATICHTTAEDGDALGVIISHGNLLHSYEAIVQAIGPSPEARVLSVLPMSHMFERGAGILVPLGVGATVSFAERQIERWRADMIDVRPTAMATIPLFLELVEQRVTTAVFEGPAWRRALFEWATELGHRHYANHQVGRRDGWWLGARRWLALRTVMRPIRNGFGGRLEYLMTGGAALPESTGLFFESIGIPVLEGYGLTETAPILTANRPGSYRYGSVGTPVAGTELRLDPASGEILARGPQITAGYLDRPAATARAIDAEGWLHTGDVGTFDEAGRLRITGRMKNLLVLATGKNVAPAPIERALETSPFIAQAVLVGDDRDQTGALLVPALRALREALGQTDGEADADFIARPEVQARLHAEVERLTADFAAYERPRRFALLPRHLSAAAGELDETGRVIRAGVLRSFGDIETALLGPDRADRSRPVRGSRSGSATPEPGPEPSPTPSA